MFYLGYYWGLKSGISSLSSEGLFQKGKEGARIYRTFCKKKKKKEEEEEEKKEGNRYLNIKRLLLIKERTDVLS